METSSVSAFNEGKLYLRLNKDKGMGLLCVWVQVPEMERATRGCVLLELHNSCPSPLIIRAFKSSRVTWDGHVERTEKFITQIWLQKT